jgi:hypothetical protein
MLYPVHFLSGPFQILPLRLKAQTKLTGGISGGGQHILSESLVHDLLEKLQFMDAGVASPALR